MTLMIINKSGIAIKMSVEDLRVMGRATQGVRLINLRDGDSIAAVAKVMKEEEDIIEAEILDIDVDTNLDVRRSIPKLMMPIQVLMARTLISTHLIRIKNSLIE